MLPSRCAIAVVGGGPAGFMAAICAAEAKPAPGRIVLLEATAEPLHKVLISGGGRCNVTHACWDPRLLVGHYPRGGRALHGPFERFAPGDTLDWFARHGLQLVEEPDGRLFPRSNRSSSVVESLRRAALAAGVELVTTAAVTAVRRCPDGFALQWRQGGALTAQRLVVATGSHPSGHRLVASLGHGLVAPVPSLFSLALGSAELTQLAGLAMDPVALELVPPPSAAATRPRSGSRHRQQGAVLITHRGLSGPAVLRLTAFAARDLRQWGYRGQLRLDWSGGLGRDWLEQRFAEARQQQARRRLDQWRPWPALARRLWWLLLAQQGLGLQGQPLPRWADLSRVQQQGLMQRLLDSRLEITGRGPFGEEFVTAGGIPLGEVNLATMESRRCPGLYLAGEILDVDGVTGGFNFQHCWTSGWLAGQALARTTQSAAAE
ncbi:MAG: NAD(P)/FAD-dependent oxidoreductase [Synechococcaceae cyanobacterium]|nr:NAD(P)/FAD-dependent oxidoreductase [Synechococcaceae cyanobacterium]